MKILSKLTRFSDWGLLAIRLGVGTVFIAHGMLKWSTWGMQPTEQLPTSMLMALKFLSIAEPLGGIAMIVGFWTPLAAIGMSLLMLIVINMKINIMHLGFIAQQSTGWELDFTLFCALLCILLVGPGKFSLEKFFSKE